jgi:protein gp37
MANRLRGRCGYPADEPFLPTFHADKLEEPLRWRKPCRVFVCSMGDLFHEDVRNMTTHRPFSKGTKHSIYAPLFDVIEACPQHTFIFLTKRPHNMALALSPDWWGDWLHAGLKNVWLGVSVENQARADERIPLLLGIPAAVRFVSVEPMLGPVDLRQWYGEGNSMQSWLQRLNWVICGCESGPSARPFELDWARSLRDQCVASNVPFFFKQAPGDKGKVVSMPELDGQVWAQYPDMER